MFVFFFKQKTAYEVRISDGSSDVCSSDLETLDGEHQGAHDRRYRLAAGKAGGIGQRRIAGGIDKAGTAQLDRAEALRQRQAWDAAAVYRKTVVEGKRLSVRLYIGGRPIVHKNNT